MKKTRNKLLFDEVKQGTCEDCGNYSEDLQLDDFGSFKCESCRIRNPFEEELESVQACIHVLTPYKKPYSSLVSHAKKVVIICKELVT